MTDITSVKISRTKAMKTIAIGDIHGRHFWKQIVEKEEFDRAIFVGDYFDSHDDISGIEQLRNFEDILGFEKTSDKEVILLIGNHDMHYFPEIGYNGTSGYQSGLATSFGFVLNENRNVMQMAYAQDNCLFSHAGICETWMNRIVRHKIVEEMPLFTAEDIAIFTNDIWEFKPQLFNFTSDGEGVMSQTGDDIGQTPVWIRPRSLMKDSQTMKKAGIVQIVGHTYQNQIDIKGKSTGSKYFFIDTLGTSHEFLVIEDGKFSSKKIEFDNV